MSNENPKNERRTVIFKIIERKKPGAEKGEVIVSLPFQTKATDIELTAYAKSQVKRLEDWRRELEEGADVRMDTHRMAIWCQDMTTGEMSDALIIAMDDNVREWKAKAIERWENECAARIGEIYDHMIARMRDMGIDNVEDASSEAWRFICARHPLFLGVWSAERQEKFMRRSKSSIRTKLHREEKKFRAAATKGHLSSRSGDKKRSVVRHKNKPLTAPKKRATVKPVSAKRDRRKSTKAARKAKP